MQRGALGKTSIAVESVVALQRDISIRENGESPFVIYFQFGANQDGYWDYNHMVLQLKDCADCQKNYPKYDFTFLFDHSSRHAKDRLDGLNATNVSVLWTYACNRDKKLPSLHQLTISVTLTTAAPTHTI